MNWFVCRTWSRDRVVRLKQGQRTGRHKTARTTVLVTLLSLASLVMSGQAFADVAALWGSVPDAATGYMARFSNPVDACQWQHDHNAPGTTFEGAVPTPSWRSQLCVWPFRIGNSYPTNVYLDCVNPDGSYNYNYKLVPPGLCVPAYEPNVSRPYCGYNKNANMSPVTGDPVIVSTGALYEEVTDYEDADKRLSIRRTYRSRTASDTYSGSQIYAPPYGVGDLWRLNFQWELQLDPNFYSNGAFGVTAPDGSNYHFTLATNGTVTANNFGVTDLTVQYSGGGSVNFSTILSSGGQFLITTSSGDQISISLFVPYWGTQYVSGRPLQITYRGGYVWTFTYGSQGQVQSIADSFGRGITFTWYYSAVYGDATVYPRAIQTITLPDGTALNYTYDSYTGTQGDNGSYARLKTYSRTSGGVTADSASYIYDSTVSPILLTGVTDNAGVRFNTWQYDLNGHVTSASHPNGADSVTIAYSMDAGNTHAYRTVTNALGLQTVYTFNTPYYSEPLLASVVGNPTSNCVGTTTTIAYDANHRQSSSTDTLGNITKFAYDSNGRLLTKTEAYGTSVQRVTSYTWNDSLGVPTQIVKPGITTNLTYDTAGRLTQRQEVDTTTQSSPYSTNGQTRTWTYGYGTANLLTSVTGPVTGNQVSYGYSTNGYLSSTTNALNQTTQITSTNGAGQPLTITDPNGVVSTLTYDADLRLASRQIAGETTSFTYTPVGLLQKVTLPDSSYVQYTYDSARRLTQVGDGAGNSIVYTLDVAGNRTAENSYDSSNVLHRTHTRVFTALSQLYQDINAAGTSAVTTTYGYDADGNQGTISAPLSRNTTNGYDALNRLNLIQDPATGYTHFTYDANDRLASVVDPRNLTTSYVYRGFGDLIGQTSPDTGSTVSTYDAAGNLLIATDARGSTTNYSYDAVNRVTQIVYKNSGGTADQTIVLGYDAGTNGKGRLTSASDANHSLTWSYDALGRVTGKGLTVGTVSKSAGYGYTNGDMTALVTPSGQSVVYGYNSNHQVTSITVNGTTVLSGVTYEPFGSANGWTWGDNSSVSRTFNGDGLISQILTAGVTLGYSFDNANRITAISDSSNSALTWTYGYDTLDRLISATTSAINDGWTYDANGNRLSQTGTTAITFSMSTTSNRLNATTGGLVRSYGYDTAGNTTSYGSNSFTYNNRGRMMSTSASSTNYIYSALGQLIEKSGTLGTTLYMYDESGHSIGEYDGSGNLIEETLWLGDIPVATLQPNGSGGVNIYYVHTDHLNSPRKIAQPTSGTLAWRWDSDPFGTATPNQNPAGLGSFNYNMRFPGQYYMAETGLNQNWNREYDPLTGRYVESDPIGLDGGLSTYAYASDDPIGGSDPTGLFTYNQGPPGTVPVPPALERKVTCLENCMQLSLVITGGQEKYKPGGGLYHSPNSLHYFGHAVDFGLKRNPGLRSRQDEFFCCALQCDLKYGGFEKPPHIHLQDVPGNGYYKPFPNTTCMCLRP